MINLGREADEIMESHFVDAQKNKDALLENSPYIGDFPLGFSHGFWNSTAPEFQWLSFDDFADGTKVCWVLLEKRFAKNGFSTSM